MKRRWGEKEERKGNKEELEKSLPEILFAINSFHNKALNTSPHLFVFGRKLETETLRDARRVVSENDVTTAEKPLAQQYENLFEKEKERLMLVEVIRNELRKTENREIIDKKIKKKKQVKEIKKPKSKLKRRKSVRLGYKAKGNEYNKTDVITIDAIREIENTSGKIKEKYRELEIKC